MYVYVYTNHIRYVSCTCGLSTHVTTVNHKGLWHSLVMCTYVYVLIGTRHACASDAYHTHAFARLVTCITHMHWPLSVVPFTAIFTRVHSFDYSHRNEYLCVWICTSIRTRTRKYVCTMHRFHVCTSAYSFDCLHTHTNNTCMCEYTLVYTHESINMFEL